MRVKLCGCVVDVDGSIVRQCDRHDLIAFRRSVETVLERGLVVPAVCGPLAGVSREYVYRLLADGRLKWERINGLGLVSLVDFYAVRTGERLTVRVNS